MFWKREKSPGKTISEYQDFVLQVAARSKAEYLISVVASPAGEGATFRAVPPALLDLLSVKIWQGDRDSETRDLQPRAASVAGPSLKEHGTLLFDFLFHETSRTLYFQSRAIAQSKGLGLRVRLKIDLGNAEAAPLNRLPWERLFDPVNQEFLSLVRETPIVRYLDLGRPSETLLPHNQLRVLVVVASPDGLPRIDADREKENLIHISRQNQKVEFVFVESADVEAIREALLRSAFQVLHFIGHGGFDEAWGEGALFFESRERSSVDRLRRVTGKMLAADLRNLKDLRLVVLNACNTAKALDGEGVSPFTGVATALLHAGVPNVLAMQYAISDSAAIAFSKAFYQRLAAGDPIDAALAEGRLAIVRRDQASSEWVIPVLMVRGETRIFARPLALPTSRLLRRVALVLLSVFLVVGVAWGWTKNRLALANKAVEAGRVQLSTNAPIRAREKFLEALKLNDDLATAYHGLGLVDAKENDLDGAVVHLQQALNREPRNWQFNLDMGRVLEKKGAVQKAVSYFRKGLEDQRCVPEVSAALGSILIRLGRLDEAEEVLKKGVKCDPKNGNLNVIKVELLMARGEFVAALKQLERPVDSMPRLDEIFNVGGIRERFSYTAFLRAKIYFKLGDLYNACPQLRAVTRQVELDDEDLEMRVKCNKFISGLNEQLHIPKWLLNTEDRFPEP